MMWRLLGILAAVLLTLWNVGCGSSKKKKNPVVPPVVTEAEQNSSGSEQDKAFELLAIQVQTIFEKNCISCHQGDEPAAGLDFTVEAVIVANAEDIADFILEGGLPAQESLSSEEVEIIRAWQEADYPRPKSVKKPGSGSGKDDDRSCEGKCGDKGDDGKDGKDGDKDPSQSKDDEHDDFKSKKKRLLKRLLRCTSK
ncbi:MAG: c-type cytochrome [Oligoflexus sp.]